jgi:potassium efflux system protein
MRNDIHVKPLPQRRLCLLFFVCCLTLLLAGSGLAGAAELPEREALQTRLEEAMSAQSDTPSDTAQREVEALKAALDGLEKLAQVERQRRELDATLEQAPEELEKLNRALDDGSGEQDVEASVDSLEDMTLEELEQQLAQASIPLQEARDRLSEIETQLLGARTLPERAQQAITDASRAIESTRIAMEELAARGVDESDPRRIRLTVELALAESQLALHQRELATNSQLRELAKQRSELLERRVTREEANRLVVQRVLDQRRREKSEATIAQAAEEEPEGVMAAPEVVEARQRNREMSVELLQATSRAHELARKNQEVRRQLDKVRQMQRGLSEHVDAIRGSILLSRILREQREALPKVTVRSGLKDEIADLRLKQFELDRQRDELLKTTQEAREQLASGSGDSALNEQRLAALEQLLSTRRKLIDQLEPAYGEQLTAAIELQLAEQQLFDISRALKATIDEQLFWVANARPLDWAWLRRLPEHLAAEWRDGEWRRGLPVHWKGLDAGALLGFPVLLAALGLFACRRRLKRRLQALHDQVGHLRFDSQAHTPKAVAITGLMALPGPMLLLAVSIALLFGAEGDGRAFGTMLLHVSLAWNVVAWARRLLVPGGVATQHFHWPEGYARQLRSWLRWLGVALVPVLVIGLLARDTGINLSQRPLAMLLLLLGLCGMSLALVKLIMAHAPYFGVKMFRLALGLVMAMVPLILGGLGMYGYTYTALSLLGRFVLTLYLLGLWILVESTVVRGLAVAARRLAYRRALARRRAMTQDSDGAGDAVEEPPLDMQQVNQQSLRLTKLILMIGFVLLLYVVWSDLLTVFGYLKQVMVFGGEGAEGAELVGGSVSVADTLVALLIFVLTLVMARNLPGLLEVMVLSRLELKQGSAYAISSLLSYAIVSSGVVISLSTLGVSWDKLQWLVAALGVGLGFGLQEIFANFISGLIILFERPVRIGDTITIGNLTGTVSRIRIRATTVIDFDLKEIIIPNKTFVTDQLINWSLSDSVTRVILKYGVAHGSDQQLVHQLLYQAAHENERVLSDPKPEVYFMAYASSTLDFELRIYVSSLGDRLLSTDELNARVVELFAEHGVVVAHERLDVRFERQSSTRTRGDDATKPYDGLVRAPDHPPPGGFGDPGDVSTDDAGGDGGDGGGDAGGR